MRPVLVEFATPSVATFRIASAIIALVLLTVAFVLVRSAKKTGTSPGLALVSLAPACIVAVLFLYFWRTHTIRLYTYGMMLLVAFSMSWFIAVREAPRFGFRPEQVTDISLLGLALGVVLARGFYVVLNLREYSGDWKQPLRLWEGGLTFHGAVAGATIAVVGYTYFHKISFWKMGDFLAPYMPLGYAIGRIGCFLNGCCHGYATTVPWGMRFLLGQFTFAQWNERLAQGPAKWPVPITEKMTPTGVDVWSRDPLHPAQIYAAILGLTIFFLLRSLRSRWFDMDGRHGRLVASFFFLFGVERFISEFFRRGVTGKPLPFFSFLTEAQAVSIALIIAGVIIWKWRMSRPPELAPEMTAKQRRRKGGASSDVEDPERSRKGGVRKGRTNDRMAGSSRRSR